MTDVAGAPARGWSLLRTLRTVRYLTVGQVLHRAWLGARFGLYAHVRGAAALGLRGRARLVPPLESGLAGWLDSKFSGKIPPAYAEHAQRAAEGRFTFMNRSLDTRGGRLDWQAPGMSRLWRYHLHYGEYVTALALAANTGDGAGLAERAWSLMLDWIDANPPGSRPGWEPYPLSLRVVNWIVALAALPAATGDPRAGAVTTSLASQARFLARHLEHHLGGNHLIKNAKALLVAGAALDAREAPRWRAIGRRLLVGEIHRQILADGGHAERSPLYHAIVLEDLVDCLALDRARPGVFSATEARELGATAARMARWLEVMRHPDGGLALFNDCVVAGPPEPATLLAYVTRVAGPSELREGRTWSLAASGYYVLASGRGRAIVDCGAVGPDELPAHAHADTLSFELAWDTERVVVDSGTAEYALDDLRRYVRSTAAHNTVKVDGVESSEVWASHRVGRRARPLDARLAMSGEAMIFAGAHDGYARLGAIHHRHILALGDTWAVVDELRGRGRHSFESFVHLHPALVVQRGPSGWRIGGERCDLRLRPIGPVAVDAGSGWYCPDWGCVLKAPTLRLSGEADVPVAFGYVLAPENGDTDLVVRADDRGVVLTGRIEGRGVELRSARCTSSS